MIVWVTLALIAVCGVYGWRAGVVRRLIELVGVVASILASILLERPVKWIEDKSGNLISTGFGRDVYLEGELALRNDGKILGVNFHVPLSLFLVRPAYCHDHTRQRRPYQ